MQRPPRKVIIIIAVAVAILLIFGLLFFFLGNKHDYSPWQPSHTTPLIVAQHGVVATDNANCSIVGRDILQNKGGNAIDAAIASMLCLGVLQNFASGVGGGGIMVIRLANGTAVTINFREWAPAAAHEGMYASNPNASLFGPLAIAVPAELVGLERAHQLYGQAKWKDLVQPAIELAQASVVGTLLAKTLNATAPYIDRWANDAFKSVYRPNGVLLQEGDILRQPKLAATLQKVASEGASAFYKGDIGSKIVDEIKKAGGILTTKDLSKYYTQGVILSEPLSSWYQGYRILGARPPISGGICSQFALNIIELFNFPKDGFVAQNIHWLIESWKYTFSDRRALGDPAKLPEVEELVITMSLKEHAAKLRNNLSANLTYDPSHYKDLSDEEDIQKDHGTSHIAVVDVYGNAVSTTTTVNGAFGSFFLSPSTGVLLNNQMDDFSSPNTSNAYNLPPSAANFIRPEKRPLSSMTPTIITKNDQLYMVVGGSGGSRIITATMQVILGVLAFSQNIAEAIAFPRLHNQLIPVETLAEVDYPPWILDHLRSWNHTIVFSNPLSAVQGIVVGDDGSLSAASDWRKLGLPAGY